MRCAACGADNIGPDHDCLERRYFLHYTNWLIEGIEPMGHPLGYRVTAMQKNVRDFQQYARAVSEVSRDRSHYHQLVCKHLDVPYSEFQPFADVGVFNRPEPYIALRDLLAAATEYLWTHTTTCQTFGHSYWKSLQLYRSYGSTCSLRYPDIYLPEPMEVSNED